MQQQSWYLYKYPSEDNCPLPIISCKDSQGKPGVCKKSASVQNSAWNLVEVGGRAELQIWEKVTTYPITSATLSNLWIPKKQSAHFPSPPQSPQLTREFRAANQVYQASMEPMVKITPISCAEVVPMTAFLLFLAFSTVPGGFFPRAQNGLFPKCFTKPVLGSAELGHSPGEAAKDPDAAQNQPERYILLLNPCFLTQFQLQWCVYLILFKYPAFGS